MKLNSRLQSILNLKCTKMFELKLQNYYNQTELNTSLVLEFVRLK